MFNKSKIISQISEKPINNEPIDVHKQPMICLFDFNEEVINELKRLRFNCTIDSCGANVQVNNENGKPKLLTLNHDYPDNLHEYDIIMIDMTKNITEEYNANRHAIKDTRGPKARAIYSAYPEKFFDPRPLLINIVAGKIKELINKKSIVIVFCGKEHIAEYQFVDITSSGSIFTDSNPMCFSLNFYNSIPERKNKYGRKAVTPKEKHKFSPLLEKYIDGVEYHTIFDHPMLWDGKKSIQDDKFVPLLFNESNEIISYTHYDQESLVLLFPDIKQKSSFVSDLFRTYLPDIIPDMFPFHGEFGWLDNGKYLLPGVAERQWAQTVPIIETARDFPLLSHFLCRFLHGQDIFKRKGV